MDTLSPEERSRIMARVRSRDTRPEMMVRRLAHKMGFRFRLHAADLPGKPDLVFRSRRKVIFVHGCYWHRHRNCALARLPKSRLDFWIPKLEANARRDAENRSRLKKMGWSVLVVWECQLSDEKRLQRRVLEFLS